MNNQSHHTVLGAGEHMRKAHLRFLSPPRVLSLDIFDPGASLPKLQGELAAEITLHSSSRAALTQRAGAVWIGSPDQFHMAQLQESLQAGKHVFVEKPLATMVEELPALKELFAYAQKNSLTVLSCHPRRFDPPFVRIKALLPSLIERYGKPLSVSFDFTYHAPVSEWKYARSLLLDHASHEIDLVNFLFGFSPAHAVRHQDTATHYHLTGKRDDGIVFSLAGTRSLSEKVYDELLRIRFERGEVSLHATRGELEIYDHERRTVSYKKSPSTQYEERNRAVTNNFIQTIAGESAPYLTQEEMLFNTEFCVRLANEGVI